MLCVVIEREYLVGRLSSVPRISCSSPEIIGIFSSSPKITSIFCKFLLSFCTDCDLCREIIPIVLSKPRYL